MGDGIGAERWVGNAAGARAIVYGTRNRRRWRAPPDFRPAMLAFLTAAALAVQLPTARDTVVPPDAAARDVRGARATGAVAGASTDSLARAAALDRLLARAAARNRNAPRSLRGYQADVLTEIGFVLRREDGTEGAGAVEQLASRARWARPGALDQQVVGYRSQSLGPNLSALTFLDRPWIVPTLYGNRLQLFFGRDTTARGEKRRERMRRRRERRDEPPLLAVHPLADDRAAVYTFAGGDTVATIRVNGRTLPIVRVRVEPRADLARRTLVFRGELDLDATRHELVRMRGQFLTVTPDRRRSLLDRVWRLAVEPLAFVELENQEIAGRYWIPARQRIELQVASPAAGDSRSVLRLQSRFREVELDVDDALAAAERAAERERALRAARVAAGEAAADAPIGAVPDTAAAAHADTLAAAPFTLALAPRDSLAAFDAWTQPLGAVTAAAQATDFDDVAPDRYRSTGAPRLEFGVERVSDLVHVNRVEGLYTGGGVRYRFRDRAPGLSLLATGGVAWNERAVRGRVTATLARRRWQAATTVGRRLDLTNDFRIAFDSGSSVNALLFSVDDYDYVDRRLATASLTRAFGSIPSVVVGGAARPRLLLTVGGGVVNDRAVAASLTRGLVRGDSGFRANRGVDEGTYLQSTAQLTWDPQGNAEFVRPGFGSFVRWERGRGDLDYDRLEARVATRRIRGPWTLAARADAGLLLGDAPPAQQLFELGGSARLPGYDYKQFAGDRAAVLAGLGMYTLPLWRAPIPLSIRSRRFVLPSPSPALSVGLQSGWTRLTTDGARAAARRLGVRTDDAGALVPIATATDGVRTTVDVGVRFFGGAIGVVLARAVDRRDGWRALLTAGVDW